MAYLQWIGYFPQLKYYRQLQICWWVVRYRCSSPLFIFLSRKHYWDLKKWLLEILWNSYENLTYQFEGKRFSKTRHFWESRIITPNSNFWDLGHSVMFKRYRQKGHFCSHIYVLCTKKSTKSTSAVITINRGTNTSSFLKKSFNVTLMNGVVGIWWWSEKCNYFRFPPTSKTASVLAAVVLSITSRLLWVVLLPFTAHSRK